MLELKKKLWIINQKEKGKLTIKEIATVQNISTRHVCRIWNTYKQKGIHALLAQQRGRKVDAIPKALQKKVISLRNQNYGIHKIAGLLYQDGITISTRKLIRLLKEHQLHTPAPEKGRRYHYVKWERKHSNSLWQTDFCWIEKLECWLTAWLDDHSRLIASAGYVDEATTENALHLFKMGVKMYGSPREVLSDRGAQYYAAGGGACSYKTYFENNGINVIYASVKKPTTCGKLERWWRTHNDERWNFSNLKKFVQHYNYARPHMSLGYLTPYEVWERDLKRM